METLFQNFPSFGFNLKLKPQLLNKRKVSMEISAFSYQKFLHFALEETQLHTHLVPSPLQDQFSYMKSMDEKSELHMLSFQAPKIRYYRSLSIECGETMQVLDFAVFPEPEVDLPIFCANFFATASMNIIVLDLNPLYDVIIRKDYKEKYYKSLIPLGIKYAELLPWGGKLTSESIRFFSPIVLWTKFTSSQHNHEILFSAFMDYYKAWLKLMDQEAPEKDASRVALNCEAQHRYLTWRAEKDPGHQLLRRLVGETAAKDIINSFLFNGTKTLGSKEFLDYFPEYRCEDGTINQKRSVIGKSFQSRPWDSEGNFISDPR
ncbi:Phycoerythrobilin ferredoxin oxidoreductase [Thalictrum thalictroides]|uniref:Phycoerythrobilin ferredoxin oxidoreductase n=1 Tax=Thalictrum thalictroides TaxID=46969 RepID=A0A7J6W5S5_THATH|nr:Phycoerythrobilin ferredoxin oxidoreductase [Thalictrum thalictroides]